MQPIVPGLPIPAAQFAELVDACRNLERIDTAGRTLIGLTIPR